MPENDHKLVQRSLRGEREAFGLLYDRHAPRIYRLLVRLTTNASQAEDLTQETLIAAYRSLASWRGQGQLSSWLCGIAVRLYRKNVRRPQLLETTLLDEDCLELAGDNDPLDSLLHQEAERRLEQAIQELPEVYREVFVLLRVEGMTQREAAEVLETPLGTVQSRLWRAVCLLRKQLSAASNESEPGSLTQKGGARDEMRFRA